MFRPMRRLKQQLPEAETLKVLKNAKRGVLSVLGDDGWPCGVWLNPQYREADGRVYFHGAKEGHKIDALRKDACVSFTATAPKPLLTGDSRMSRRFRCRGLIGG